MKEFKNFEVLNEYVVNHRRNLHQIPERGSYLPKTQDYVCKELEKLGINYEKNTVEYDGNVDSGIIAIIEGKSPGKCIALRADMDALPIKENSGESFSSTHDGFMHACGHDIHTSMLLGAAKYLSENNDKFNGTVKLMFQSAEEIIMGAKLMIKQGAMENPKVDAVFGMHVWPLPQFKTGAVITGPGTMMASGDQFKIHIHGLGAHGYKPDSSIDPVLTLAEIALGLQRIRSREFPVDEAMVLSVCQIHGGTGWNIIGDYAWAEGTVRTMSPEKREFARKRIEEISINTAKAHRAKCEVEWVNGTPAVVNNEELTDLAMEAAKDVLGDEYVQHFDKPTMGNEDVSWYFDHAPGCFAFLNISNEEKGINYPLHSPEFRVDESILWRGSAMYAITAMTYLSK